MVEELKYLLIPYYVKKLSKSWNKYFGKKSIQTSMWFDIISKLLPWCLFYFKKKINKHFLKALFSYFPSTCIRDWLWERQVKGAERYSSVATVQSCEAQSLVYLRFHCVVLRSLVPELQHTALYSSSDYFLIFTGDFIYPCKSGQKEIVAFC